VDRLIIELQAGCDEKEIVRNALSGGCDNDIGNGIKLGNRLLDPLHTARNIVGICLGNVARLPEPGGDERKARLEVVRRLSVDENDCCILHLSPQAGGKGETRCPCPRDDHARSRNGSLRRCSSGRQHRGH
jgi:hypothetical protein